MNTSRNAGAQSNASAVITGHHGLLWPTEYVRACDLHGKDVTIAIDHLEWEVLQMQGGKKERKPVVYMRAVGKDGAPGKMLGKRFALNKTNSKLIAATLGDPDVSTWAGKRITIFPTKCRGADGTQVECIRVRARVNASAAEVPEDMSAAPAPRVEFVDEAEGAGGEVVT